MEIFTKKINSKFVIDVTVSEHKHNIKCVLFTTHGRNIPFSRASDDVYLFGDKNEILEIPELKNINPNHDWMVYYSQEKDQIEILYIPFELFED